MNYRRSGVGKRERVCVCVYATYCVLFFKGVAVLQGLLFAIGGYLEGKTSTDAVECYNPRTMR